MQKVNGRAEGGVRGGALDLLRFLAAFLIVLYHFGAEAPMRLEDISPVFQRGYLATDFFLMLSGYVLGRAYGPQVAERRISHRRFLARRVARVWPAHLIILAGFVAFVLTAEAFHITAHNPTRFAWPDLAYQVALVHAWGLPGGDGWNLPSWSLSALLVCYALFPWLWRWVVSIRTPGAPPALGVIGLVAFDVLTQAVLAHPIYDLPFQFGVLRALPLFFLGACLATTAARGQPSVPAARLLFWGGLVAFVLLQVFGRFDLASMMAIASVILGAGRLPVVRSSATVERLAKLSFALFITHIFVGMFWFIPIHSAVAATPIGLEIQWPLWALSFPLALAGAWAFDRYVDAPLQSRIARWLRKPAKARTAADEAPASERLAA